MDDLNFKEGLNALALGVCVLKAGDVLAGEFAVELLDWLGVVSESLHLPLINNLSKWTAGVFFEYEFHYVIVQKVDIVGFLF